LETVKIAHSLIDGRYSSKFQDNESEKHPRQAGTPGFGADASALGGAFVAVEASGRKVHVHAGIRSRVKGENKDGALKGRRYARPTAKRPG